MPTSGIKSPVFFFKDGYKIEKRVDWRKEEFQFKILSSHHRFYIGGFEGGYQSLVIVDAWLIHLPDSVGQNARPRDGEPVVTHLKNNNKIFVIN